MARVLIYLRRWSVADEDGYEVEFGEFSLNGGEDFRYPGVDDHNLSLGLTGCYELFGIDPNDREYRGVRFSLGQDLRRLICAKRVDKAGVY